MERPTCETCVYWNEINQLKYEGECKRHSPRPVSITYQQGAIEPDFHNCALSCWPITMDDDWCGDHPDFPAYLASLRTAASNSADLDATRE
jgi:hypothetical protein